MIVDVTEAEFFWMGLISEISNWSLREQFDVAFQVFQIYAATVAENVSMSPVSAYNRGKVEEAVTSGEICAACGIEPNSRHKAKSRPVLDFAFCVLTHAICSINTELYGR